MGKADVEYREAMDRAKVIESQIFDIERAMKDDEFAKMSKDIGDRIDALEKQLAKLIDNRANGPAKIAAIRKQAQDIRDRANATKDQPELAALKQLVEKVQQQQAALKNGNDG